MFRHLQNSWIGHDTPLTEDDCIDVDAAARALAAAANSESEAFVQLAKLARFEASHVGGAGESSEANHLPERLWNIIVHKQLYRDPAFSNLNLSDTQAADLQRYAQRGRDLELGDHLWLNRYLVHAAFESAEAGPLFRSTKNQFGAVVVSDAGRQFAVSRRTKAGGLVGVALRASDILMDRVWQMECDTFYAEPDFLFAPIAKRVALAEDRTALHPELQQQVEGIRTDLDRFSELEISALIQHGYGVMRSVCRSRPDVFGEHRPDNPPWDPAPQLNVEGKTATGAPSRVTRQARRLRESAHRKLFAHLLTPRDWPSYIFVPMLLALLIGVPFVAYQAYRRAHRSEMIVDAITFSNPDFQHVLQLARRNPTGTDWTALTAETVPSLDPVVSKGFRLITDTRVTDIRAWNPESSGRESQFVVYRRMQVRRVAMPSEEQGANEQEAYNKFRLQQFSLSDQVSVRCDAEGLGPRLRVAPAVNEMGRKGFLYEIEFDLSSVPEGQDFDIGFELTDVGLQGRLGDANHFDFAIIAPTDVATMWVFLPVGRPYQSFKVIAYDSKAPVNVESIEPTYDFQMADGSLFGWMLVAPRDGYTYESRWNYRN